MPDGIASRQAAALAALVACASILCLAGPAQAEQKVFSAGGDGTTWHDSNNWFVTGIPSTGDTVLIDFADVETVTDQDFLAKTVLIGGKQPSTWIIEPGVSGTIVPPATSDLGIHLRKQGSLVLKGSGTIVVKGGFKNSEESLPSESSVMILLQ